MDLFSPAYSIQWKSRHANTRYPIRYGRIMCQGTDDVSNASGLRISRQSSTTSPLKNELGQTRPAMLVSHLAARERERCACRLPLKAHSAREKQPTYP